MCILMLPTHPPHTPTTPVCRFSFFSRTFQRTLSRFIPTLDSTIYITTSLTSTKQNPVWVVFIPKLIGICSMFNKKTLASCQMNKLHLPNLPLLLLYWDGPRRHMYSDAGFCCMTTPLSRNWHYFLFNTLYQWNWRRFLFNTPSHFFCQVNKRKRRSPFSFWVTV